MLAKIPQHYLNNQLLLNQGLKPITLIHRTAFTSSNARKINRVYLTLRPNCNSQTTVFNRRNHSFVSKKRPRIHHKTIANVVKTNIQKLSKFANFWPVEILNEKGR